MPVLVQQFRGNVVESMHIGDLAVVHHSGRIVANLGDVNRLVFMRSAIKPVFAQLLLDRQVDQRFKLSEPEIAIISGSHTGEFAHIRAIQSMLEKGALSEANLKCGTHLPHSLLGLENLILSKQSLSPIYHNCSGFHVGMLLFGKFFDMDLDEYNVRTTMVQEEIYRTLVDLCELDSDEVEEGIDDCNVPTYAIPLWRLAYLYARIGHLRISNDAMSLLWKAITRNPLMLAGTDTLETDLIFLGNDVLAKIGSGGIYCVSIPKLGLGLSIKLDSDSYQAVESVAMRALIDFQAIPNGTQKLMEKYLSRSMTGYTGAIISQFKPTFHL